MLIEFTLPSNPSQTIRLREATVADVLDFTAVDPRCEEQATSLFLERMQEKETYSDPRKWTGEDRRFALFQYFLNTTNEKSVPLSYSCSICGGKHTQEIAFKKIADAYTPISGDAFREVVHEGHNIVVKPLNGADLETVERLRFDLELTEDRLEEQNLSPTQLRALTEELRQQRTRIYMLMMICRIDMPYLDPAGTPASRRDAVMDVVQKMPLREFHELEEKVSAAIIEMRHGLRTSYVDGQIALEIPDVKCLKNPEAPGILLRYPFRFSSIIPRL
ncbi:MAG: hypothetical protein IJU76_14265 [Desulfovibrionaceae bacterium]|nr:hypothetical protein [Desulfovibrionaceae bacterium]